MATCSHCESESEDFSPGATICRPCRREKYKVKNRFCTTCGEELTGGGSHSQCKACKSVYDRDRKVRLLQEYKEYLSAIGCGACGENHPHALECHHLSKGSKRFNNGRTQSHQYNRQDLERGIAMVLCSSCHSIFHGHFGGKQADFPEQTEETCIAIIKLERESY